MGGRGALLHARSSLRSPLSHTLSRPRNRTHAPRLRNKGAITTSGRPLQAVQLSPEEEDYIGTGMLIKLAQAGIILY